MQNSSDFYNFFIIFATDELIGEYSQKVRNTLAFPHRSELSDVVVINGSQIINKL